MFKSCFERYLPKLINRLGYLNWPPPATATCYLCRAGLGGQSGGQLCDPICSEELVASTRDISDSKPAAHSL